MPFDVMPQEVETKFKAFADAMLRGCAVTTQIEGIYLDGEGGACALGALFVGLGAVDPLQRCGELDPVPPVWELIAPMTGAYYDHYGTKIHSDNDGGMSREEIAARIAAL